MTPSNTPVVLRNPTRSEIPGLLAELDASGLGVAAFARARNLKPQNLYIANRKRRTREDPVPVFDPVRILGSGHAPDVFELHLRTGHQIFVSADFDAAALRRLLGVLHEC